VCDQKRKGSEDGAMEQNDGFGLGIWGMAEVIDVAVRTEATKDPDTGWRINRQALGADGYFAVIADADVEALTPDKGPPGAVGGGTQDRALFGAGLVTRGGACRVTFKRGKECAIKSGNSQKTGQWSRTMGLALGSGAWRR